ncbi:tetratricopeptide repeat protein [Thermodesulfobacteriota bacterium]
MRRDLQPAHSSGIFDKGLSEMLKNIYILSMLLIIVFSTLTEAAEGPEELYRKGNFAEAEKVYAGEDMDHPKDVRYRYNRGCAAYQNSDFKGASAAFSSVLRRAKDDNVRFRAAYNLGNTAFRNGDFQSAVEYFRQSIILNPDNTDARYNLELALRERQKRQEEGQQKNSDQQKKDRDHSKDGQSKDQENNEKSSAQEKKEDQDKKGEKGDNKNNQDGKPKKGEGHEDKSGQRTQKKTPTDLSGELRPLQEMREEEETDKTENVPLASVDKKKAEALLDNIKEDRSRFLRFRIPEDKRRGVVSGKHW